MFSCNTASSDISNDKRSRTLKYWSESIQLHTFKMTRACRLPSNYWRTKESHYLWNLQCTTLTADWKRRSGNWPNTCEAFAKNCPKYQGLPTLEERRISEKRLRSWKLIRNQSIYTCFSPRLDSATNAHVKIPLTTPLNLCNGTVSHCKFNRKLWNPSSSFVRFFFK